MKQESHINPFGVAFLISCFSLLCSPILAFFNTSPYINLTLTQILAPTVFAAILLPTMFIICVLCELLRKE